MNKKFLHLTTDEVSQRAARQSLDQAREFLDKVKEVLEA